MARTKNQPKRVKFYPVVVLPTLIQTNLPQKISVRKLVPSPPDSVPQIVTQISSKKIRYSHQVFVFGWLFSLGLIAIFLRFWNVYTHNGMAVMSAVISVVSLIFGSIQIDKEEAAQAVTSKKAAIAKPDPPPVRYHTEVVEQWQVPNWQSILNGRVKPHTKLTDSTVQRGISEAKFEEYLGQYFSDIIKPSYSFEIPNADKFYSADFCLVLSSGLSLCIEVDEPYIGNTKEPHHCIDQDKDDQRDAFFLEGNWIVIRFSEKQVVTQPTECCFLIAQTIAQITRNFKYLKQFDRDTKKPTLEQCWTIAQAKQMAKSDARQTYLGSEGSPNSFSEYSSSLCGTPLSGG
jgi:very-short-patch-repair endonuclease